MFSELLDVCGDGRVRYLQNFGDAAIIHFNLEHLRIRITLRKFENVLEVGAPPGVDRLRVVAHYHDVVMIAGEQINEISLNLVRVLVFIDENELELPPVNLGDSLVLLKHRQRLLQQIVEIHRVGRLLLLFVARPDVLNLVEQREEIRKLFRKQFLHRFFRIDDEAEDLRKHLAFRKSDLLRIDPCAGYDSIDQILLIFAVHDREPARVTERGAVPAQDAVSHRMKCSAPESAGIERQQIRDAAQHFAGGFVRECEKQNVSRIDSVFQQVRNAIGEGACFPRARASDHKERTWRRSHCRKLLFV